MGAALKVMPGPDAKGLSANMVSRLKRDWAKEYQGWKDAAFDDEPIVYIWADGVHSGLRGEDDKLCALVIVGVTAVVRSGSWPLRTGCAKAPKAGVRFFSTSKIGE